MTHHPLEDQIIPSPCPSSSSMSGSSDGSSKKASTQRFWWQMSFNVLQIQPWPVSIIVSCFSYLSRAHHTHPTKLYSSFFRSFLGEPISAIHCNLAYSVFAKGCLHRNQGCYYYNRINWIQDIQDIQKYNLMKKNWKSPNSKHLHHSTTSLSLSSTWLRSSMISCELVLALR